MFQLVLIIQHNIKIKKLVFSLKMEKAYWTKEVDKAAFINYFASKLGQSASNEDFRSAVLNFQQNTRKNYFTYNAKSLKLTLVRSKFNLRSTFFSVSDNGSTVKLNGRGFGHLSLRNDAKMDSIVRSISNF